MRVPGQVGVLVGPLTVLVFAWLIVDVPCTSAIARFTDATLTGTVACCLLGALTAVGGAMTGRREQVLLENERTSPLDSEMAIPLLFFASAGVLFGVGLLLQRFAVSPACAAGVGYV